MQVGCLFQKPMEEIEVSGKHIKLRVVAFVLALIVGITAFGVGIRQIANREPGYYEITAVRDETAPLYSNGISLYCYFGGESSAIKEKLQASEALYSEALGRIYRLLDPRETYDGYVNLATLNQHPGETMALPEELFFALTDALERTEGQAYSVLNGAMRDLWQELLYLEEPETFDPLCNEEQRARFQAVFDALTVPDAIRLQVVDAAAHTVRLEVSDALAAVLEKYEVEGPLLDLGSLREAYILQYVRDRLVAAGFLRGYLKTQRGLSLMLPETEEGKQLLSGYVDGTSQDAAYVSLNDGAACCALRAFSVGDPGYYVVDGVLRHPNLGDVGDIARQLLTVWIVSPTGDVVDAAVKAAVLFQTPDDLLRQRLKDFGAEGAWAAMIEAASPKTILADPLHPDAFHPLTDYGFSVAVP